MRFERLEILNFASYYGEHMLDLSTSDERPVIVVVGGTGFGKTTLFDALNWALYGSEYEEQLKQRRSRKIEDYVNEVSLQDAEAAGKFAPMACTVYFEHDGQHYYITQELIVRTERNLVGDLTAVRSDRATALYRVAPNGNHDRMEYDSIFMNEILPSNVRDYFLFDGDRIYQLSNPGSSQEVRNAIYRVVDLELISSAIEHLEQVESEYRREVRRHSSAELSTVSKEYDDAKDRLSQLKRDLKNLQAEDEKINAQIQKLEGQLLQLSETSEKQNEYNLVSQHLGQLHNAQRDAMSQLRQLSSPAALTIAEGLLRALESELEQRRERGQIPRRVSQALIRDLLEMRECLCGTSLSPGSDAFHRLSERLQQEQQRSSGQGALELLIQLQSAHDSVMDSRRNLMLKGNELDECQTKIRELDIKLNQITAELEALPDGNINQLTSDLRERRSDMRTNDRKIESVRSQLGRVEGRIDELGKQREKLGKQQNKVRRIQLREQVTRDASELLAQMYKEFAEDSRSNVEQLTREVFQEFVYSASEYDVRLTEDYELQVVDSNGNPALARLSMGQSQCLSLAFITSIARVSEKNPPIAIDMPFGRLDAQVHDRVSNRLPKLASQLLLFLIPQTEWYEGTIRNLEPKASKIYHLDFDPKQRTTTIESATIESVN